MRRTHRSSHWIFRDLSARAQSRAHCSGNAACRQRSGGIWCRTHLGEVWHVARTFQGYVRGHKASPPCSRHLLRETHMLTYVEPDAAQNCEHLWAAHTQLATASCPSKSWPLSKKKVHWSPRWQQILWFSYTVSCKYSVRVWAACTLHSDAGQNALYKFRLTFRWHVPRSCMQVIIVVTCTWCGGCCSQFRELRKHQMTTDSACKVLPWKAVIYVLIWAVKKPILMSTYDDTQHTSLGLQIYNTLCLGFESTIHCAWALDPH